MSDSDDGFDREAVREELREKYENDREDREATARMSELLLQGATMTNQHCDRCGAPIFRYDGETFCPQCQHEAQGDGEQTDTSRQSDAAPQAVDEKREPTQPPTAGQSGDRRDPPTTAGGPRERAADQAREPRDLPERPRQDVPAGEAADALESSIAALAQRAAAADDPRTAREYLEAAREAAEALAALR